MKQKTRKRFTMLSLTTTMYRSPVKVFWTSSPYTRKLRRHIANFMNDYCNILSSILLQQMSRLITYEMGPQVIR